MVDNSGKGRAARILEWTRTRTTRTVVLGDRAHISIEDHRGHYLILHRSTAGGALL